jgi:hypothetical protein
MSEEQDEGSDDDPIFMDAVIELAHRNNNNNNNNNNSGESSRIDVIVPQTQDVAQSIAPVPPPSQPEPPLPDQSKRAIGRPKKPTNPASPRTTALAVINRPPKPPRKKALSSKRKLLTAAGEAAQQQQQTDAPSTAAREGRSININRHMDSYDDLALINVQTVARCIGALMQEREDYRTVDPAFVFLLASGVQKYALSVLQAADTFRSIGTDVKLVNARHVISADSVLRLASGESASTPAAQATIDAAHRPRGNRA